MRFELMTPSLPWKCSTTELSGQVLLSFKWSGRRDSNPQPSAWKADALPIELLPHRNKKWWWVLDSNQRKHYTIGFTARLL